LSVKGRDLPEVGELVIATVTEVFDKGAYVNLDEYSNVSGYVPIGEVASTWIHNIRDYLKEGRKVVLKVIRVDKSKGDVLGGFEEAARFGLAPIVNAGVPRDLAEYIVDLAKENIELKEVKVAAILQLTSEASDGIVRIIEALKAAKMKAESIGGVKCRIYSVGAPRYRVDISARDYKVAEEALKTAVDATLHTISSLGGSGSFKRV
jgi:translation initiation factor 2 subunit 1